MRYISFEIHNKLDFFAITNALSNQNIEYTARNLQDSAFPKMIQLDPFGVIEVKEDDVETVKLIIEQLKLSQPSTTTFSKELPIENKPFLKSSSNSSKLKTILFLAIAYGVFVSFYAFKLHKSQKLQNTDKNFIYEWNKGGEILTTKLKYSTKIVTISHDYNYDDNWEAMTTYSIDKKHKGMYSDKDENGFFENVVYYSNNKYTGKQSDRNNDANFDYSEFILENGDTLVLVDNDFDGFYHIKE